MYFGKFPLGLRTIKTAIAVALCMLFFYITNRGNPVIAALAAVFALRQDFSTSIDFSKSRVLSAFTGGACALIYTILMPLIHKGELANLLLIPTLVLITISISVAMGNKTGVIGAVATLLVIIFSIPQSESLLYALNRIIDTFIGAIFALMTNKLLPTPKEDHNQTIEHKMVEILEHESAIKKLKQEIEELEK